MAGTGGRSGSSWPTVEGDVDVWPSGGDGREACRAGAAGVPRGQRGREGANAIPPPPMCHGPRLFA